MIVCVMGPQPESAKAPIRTDPLIEGIPNGVGTGKILAAIGPSPVCASAKVPTCNTNERIGSSIFLAGSDRDAIPVMLISPE